MEDFVVIDPEHLGVASKEPVVGLVLATFRDCAGAKWIAFDVAHLHGLHLIATESKHFMGFEGQ